MLRLAVQEMPHGLSVFDGDDKLVFANRQVAKVWDVPETLYLRFVVVLRSKIVGGCGACGRRGARYRLRGPAGW